MSALAGRLARCPYCKTTKPSSPDLAFFEFRGPGSSEAEEHCGHCGYHRMAHDPEHMRDPVRGKTVIEDGRCPGPGSSPAARWSSTVSTMGVGAGTSTRCVLQ